jgi:Na+-driven multidrug efflux pump
MKKKMQEKTGLFTMIWPIIVELLITGLIANTNQAILNDFSPDAVAVTSSGSLIVTVVLNLYCFISIGMTILLAPYVGAKRYEECKRLISAALTVNVILGIIISFIGILLIPSMIRIMNIPEELHGVAKQYLLISIGFSFLQSILITINAVFRSLGEMKKVLVTMISVSLICLIISKLIYLFLPRTMQNMLLYTLAGIIAQLVGIIIFVVMLYRYKEMHYRYSVKGLFYTIRIMLPRILHYGIPAGFEGLVYLISQTTVVSFIGLLGTEALLTKAFAGNVYYYMAITTAATAAGASIVVGHLIGAGKMEKVHEIGRKVIVIDFIITAFVSLFLLIIGPKFLRIYTEDTFILSTAMKIIFLNVILELIKCLTGNLIAILKAIGDVGFPFMIVILGSIINIGISYCFGIALEFGLVGIWFGYIADVLFRGVVSWIRFRSIMRRWSVKGETISVLGISEEAPSDDCF